MIWALKRHSHRFKILANVFLFDDAIKKKQFDNKDKLMMMSRIYVFR